MVPPRPFAHQGRSLSRSSSRSAPLTLVIADTHLLFRQALRHYVEEQGIRVVGEAADAYSLVSVTELRRPDVVLVDIALLGDDAARAIQRLKSRCPDARVVVLVGHDTGAFFSAARAGADGILLKDTPVEEVLAAIRTVTDGGSVVSPALLSELLREFRRLSSLQDGEPPAGLTTREIQLLRLVASGLSNKEIADTLGLAESTVKNRLSLLFEKLGVKDRTQAAIYALVHGLLPQDEPAIPPIGRHDLSGSTGLPSGAG